MFMVIIPTKNLCYSFVYLCWPVLPSTPTSIRSSIQKTSVKKSWGPFAFSVGAVNYSMWLSHVKTYRFKSGCTIQVMWLKVELCRLLEERRSAVLRSVSLKYSTSSLV